MGIKSQSSIEYIEKFSNLETLCNLYIASLGQLQILKPPDIL